MSDEITEMPLPPIDFDSVPYCLHLIDTTGRHYVFDIDSENLIMLVNKDQFIWSGRDNNLHDKFVELYQKLMVEQQSLCVLTPRNSLMLHSRQITGIQLTKDPRL